MDSKTNQTALETMKYSKLKKKKNVDVKNYSRVVRVTNTQLKHRTHTGHQEHMRNGYGSVT